LLKELYKEMSCHNSISCPFWGWAQRTK